jgi:excisionase family DNA binding protein
MSTVPRVRHLLHVKEAADELDVSPWTIRRAIKKGELPAVRIGERGNYRIRSADLDEFLRVAGP